MVKLGYAAGKVFAAQSGGKATLVIGKDTRVSGYMIESALQAGIVASDTFPCAGAPCCSGGWNAKPESSTSRTRPSSKVQHCNELIRMLSE